jgi:hypothetical protein
MEEWQTKQTTESDSSVLLPGEKKVTNSFHTKAGEPLNFLCYGRFKSLSTATWVVARVRKAIRQRSFSAGKTANILVTDLRDARRFLIKEAQHKLIPEFTKPKGKFLRLKPAVTESGLWIVGGRFRHSDPTTSLKTHTPALLPTNHPLTQMAMAEAHQHSGHRGRDATLARFREEFWTPHGARVAASVVFQCQECKLRDPKLLSQGMAPLPKERLTIGPPFNHTMVDLFGPVLVSGEVQRRTSGKAYGVLFTDMVSRAVHIEGVFGYDAPSFLLALRRFVSIRGWPQRIYSDPGSQLVGAEKEVAVAWREMGKENMIKVSTEHGTEWVFGPADSPWYQGAAEALVKTVKRGLRFSLSGKKLTATEFSTACYEVSNLVNKQPLGLAPAADSDISILTPNCLLLGRPFAKNPGSWESTTSLKGRLQLVASVVADFWVKWKELFVPTLVAQNKWYGKHRDLKVGDVVLMVDSNPLSKQYRLARVHEVFPGLDGRVRRVSLNYKNYRIQGGLIEYHGCKDTVVTRSVQRLALLVPVEDQ